MTRQVSSLFAPLPPRVGIDIPPALHGCLPCLWPTALLHGCSCLPALRRDLLVSLRNKSRPLVDTKTAAMCSSHLLRPPTLTPATACGCSSEATEQTKLCDTDTEDEQSKSLQMALKESDMKKIPTALPATQPQGHMITHKLTVSRRPRQCRVGWMVGWMDEGWMVG